jgi:hypothetical protein
MRLPRRLAEYHASGRLCIGAIDPGAMGLRQPARRRLGKRNVNWSLTRKTSIFQQFVAVKAALSKPNAPKYSRFNGPTGPAA